MRSIYRPEPGNMGNVVPHIWNCGRCSAKKIRKLEKETNESNSQQHIRMISEGSCDTEDWSNDAEYTALLHRN